MAELDIEIPVPPEPSRGSVVLHPALSIAYIRDWGGNWRSTSSIEKNKLNWETVWERCDQDPIILLDTNGYAYDMLDHHKDEKGRVIVL